MDTNAQKSSEPAGRKRGKDKDNHNDSTLNPDKQDTQPKLFFNSEPFKLLNNHLLFERLVEVVVSQFENLNIIYWTPMTENAIHCVFKVSDQPIFIIETLLTKIIEKLPIMKGLVQFTPNNKGKLPPVPLFNGEDQTEPSQTQTQVNPVDDQMKTSFALMTRFVSMIGIVATKLLVFMNQFVVCELKRRKMCKENKSNLVIITKLI